VIISYGVAVLAAASNAASNVLQRKANRDQPSELSLSPKLMVELVKDKAWLAGLVTVILSFVLTAVALSGGRLAAVQPIIVLELPMTLVGSALVFHAGLHRREWAASAAMTVGLVGLVFFLAPTGGRTSVAWYVWLIGLGAASAIMVALVAIGRSRSPAGKAAIFGVATGLAFGITAVLMKAMTARYSAGITGILTAWQTYLMIAAGIAGMFLMQNALQAGRLVAAQPGITLIDPLVAILWGTLVYHEQARSGIYLPLAAVSGVLVGAGAVILARSPLLVGQGGGEEEGRDDLALSDSRSSLT
jgi:drug/metabolite transporter (DMT)-like permease